MINDWFDSGRVIDLVLLVVVLELAVLGLWRRARGAMGLADVAFLIAPGVMLMLAVRVEMTGGAPMKTAALLAAAFVFHLLDVLRRRKGAAQD